MERKALTNYTINKTANLDRQSNSQGTYMLTTNELVELRQDMAESSAKMRTELARRRNDLPD